MTLAFQPSHPHNNAWEETIVPTLRRRLEHESRLLENRLSVHSLTSSREDHPLPPTASSSQQYVVSRKEGARSATPSSRQNTTSPIYREPSDTYRPTGIPRPSSSMSKDPHAPLSASTSKISNGSGSQRVPFTRQRTRSTPYPFDRDEQENGQPPPPSKNSTTNLPTPASSRANSPMIVGGRPSEPRPSRIPVVTRKRARSTSNPGSLDNGKTASVGRAAGAQHQQHSSKKATLPHGVTFPPSPETSPDLWRDEKEPAELLHPVVPNGAKIRDEAPIFNPNRLSHAASFEEREFEHWYRGEGRDGGGRNGGRGEIKMAKADTATEMLAIAVGGHNLEQEGNRRSRYREEPFELDHRTKKEAERMDYVPDERELSDMERDGMSDAHLPHRPVTNEGLEYYYTVGGTEEEEPRMSSSSQPAPPSSSSHTHRSGQATPARNGIPRPSMDRSNDSHASQSRGVVASVSTPRKSGPSTKNPKTPNNKARSQSKPRQRAVSKPQKDAAGALADATPPWASPPPPQGGNWDDVVLPAVAKKMGVNSPSVPEVTMLGGPGPSSKPTRPDTVYEPAPGTFAYKDRPSMDQARPPASPNEFGRGRPQSPETPKPIEYKYPPMRTESPPPFASYGLEEPQPPPKPVPLQPPQPQPYQQPELSAEDMRLRQKELRKTKPAIVVTSPTHAPPAQKRDDDEDDAGCCKCVIM